MLVMTRMHWAFTHKWLLPVFLGLALAGCGSDIESAATPRDIEKKIVRAELAGVRFNVPLNYMYQEAIEKRKHWPEPKSERVSVGALTISVLLPNLQPYQPTDDARWKVKGHGERVELSITKPVGSPDWYRWLRTQTDTDVTQGKGITRKDDIYMLAHFQEQVFDRYFPLNGRPLTISCSKTVPGFSASCRTKTDYRTGIVFEYYYGREHLPHWREIDDGLKRLVDKFVADAS